MEPRNALPLLGFRRRLVRPSVTRDHPSRESAAIVPPSALLTQTKSRIGHKCGMRKRLGEANWAAFVKHAEAEHKAAFFRAFTPASVMLCCEGKLPPSAPLPTLIQASSVNSQSHNTVAVARGQNRFCVSQCRARPQCPTRHCACLQKQPRGDCPRTNDACAMRQRCHNDVAEVEMHEHAL